MLKSNELLNIHEILNDLENYVPKRHGWSWRKSGTYTYDQFNYVNASEPLKNSIPLKCASSFNHIDPQPDCVITTEIASGKFEDDIRRMRMAAYHGADHIMVIRTAGQSHFDGLIEGTPQGIGGIPITRKQIRAQRKALDLIEEEVGRPINYHSYISGVAGPEMAVMFYEEGVNGAHQDPQYNVLYRNINMVRSFVDAFESKKIMAHGKMLQIDGAHNANATAKDAWKVMPELLVQHSINCVVSRYAGLDLDHIALSTVPPSAPPTPDLKINLPYSVALRDFFEGYKFRAQMNTKYMNSSTKEATVTHVLNLLISRLTSADIQSTITPDEGRNVPWHIYNIEALDTAKQVLLGLDDLKSLVSIREDGYMKEKVREIKERAILFMEGILNEGGYFDAVQRGMFVDSGIYPERNGDGISRDIKGGIGKDTVFERDTDYFAPVSVHFGYNNVEQYNLDLDASIAIGGDSFIDRAKVSYIDELDPSDNVNVRLQDTEIFRNKNQIKPEVQWLGDGFITIDLFFPVSEKIAYYAALEVAKKMNLKDVEVIHTEVLHPTEGTRVQVKGMVDYSINIDELVIPEEIPTLSEDEIYEFFKQYKCKVIAATVGEDEHSVGLREIIDIKHGGIEKYGIQTHYLGTSVKVEKIIDAAIELDVDAILVSTIISHDDIHYKNMKNIHQYAIERGVRDRFIIMSGGTQVIKELAKESGMDDGFGRGTKGKDVASSLVELLRTKNEN